MMATKHCHALMRLVRTSSIRCLCTNSPSSSHNCIKTRSTFAPRLSHEIPSSTTPLDVSKVLASTSSSNTHYLHSSSFSGLPEVNGDGDNFTTLVEDGILKMSKGLRTKQRVKQQDFRSVVKLIVKGASVGEHGTFLLTLINTSLPDILPQDKVELSQNLWRAIEREGKITSESLDAVLKCFTECEFTDYQPFEFFEKASKALSECQIDGRTMQASEKSHYYTLLSYCQAGDLKNAVKILDLLKGRSIPVDENYFNAFILGNARAGVLQDINKVFEIMKASNMEATSKTYANLMHTYLEAGKSKELEKIYQLGYSEKIELDEASIFNLIRKAVVMKDDLAFKLLLSWIPKVEHNSLIVRDTIIHLIHAGFPMEATKILLNCSDTLSMVGAHFGAFVIKEIVIANCDLNVIKAICDEIEGAGLIEISPVSLAAESSLRHNKFDYSVRLFEVMKQRNLPVRPHYFWPVLLHCSDVSGLVGILEAVQTMRRLEVAPDWETLTDIILPKIFSIEDDCLQVAKILKESGGLSYSSGLLKAIMVYLLRKRRLKDAAYLSRKIRGTIAQPTNMLDLTLTCILQVDSRHQIHKNVSDVASLLSFVFHNTPSDDKNDYIGKFISRFCDAVGPGSGDLITLLLKELQEEDIRISEGALNILKDAEVECSIAVDENLTYVGLSRQFTHPKEMDVHALVCHIEELKSKGMNPRGAQRLLFLKYCQSNDVTKVEQQKSEFESSYGSLSTGMLSSLLGFYLRQAKLDSAIDIFYKVKAQVKTIPMTDKFFEVDFYKILDLSMLMAENGQLEDALLFLKNEWKSNTSKGSKPVTGTVVRLLEAFGKAGGDVNEILDYLLEANLVEPSVPIMAVVIKYHLERDDKVKAVEQFQEFAVKYNMTPSLIQLLHVVLGKGNEEFLEKVYKSSVAVKGEIEIRHCMAFAMSDLGEVAGASRLLKDLGKSLSLRRIGNHAVFIANRNEIYKLINLVKALQGSNQQTSDLSSQILAAALKSCQRTRDLASLEAILQLLQENSHSTDFIPSHLMKLALDVKGLLGGLSSSRTSVSSSSHSSNYKRLTSKV